MDTSVQDMSDHMDQAISILREDLGTIRAGRSNPQLIEHLKISAYGGSAELMLSELATITSSDTKTLVVTPFDQTITDEIEKGINQANLGVTVARDGTTIRISMPPMTEERRQEFIKLSKVKTEGVLVMIRQARQETMNQIKHQQQNGDMSEDDKFRLEKEAQKVTEEKSKEAETLLETKIKELETV